MVVTSMRRFFVKGRATPASHSWKCAMTAFVFSWHTYCVLLAQHRSWYSPAGTYLSKEPGDKVTEDDCFICFIVTRGRRNGSQIPEVRFPLIQVSIRGFGVNQDDPWSSFNQPAPVKYTDTAISHRLDGSSQLWDGWFELLDFDSSLLRSAERQPRT